MNGLPLPPAATLSDAVTLLKGVGRPVLVAFRSPTPSERAADARQAAAAAAPRAKSPPPVSRQSAPSLGAVASYVTNAAAPSARGVAMPSGFGRGAVSLRVRPPPRRGRRRAGRLRLEAKRTDNAGTKKTRVVCSQVRRAGHGRGRRGDQT